MGGGHLGSITRASGRTRFSDNKEMPPEMIPFWVARGCDWEILKDSDTRFAKMDVGHL